MAQLYGNVHSSYFPLFFDNFPSDLHHLKLPMHISNQFQRWNDAHLLQFQLVDTAGNTFKSFSKIYLFFEVDDFVQTELKSNRDIDFALEQQ